MYTIHPHPVFLAPSILESYNWESNDSPIAKHRQSSDRPVTDVDVEFEKMKKIQSEKQWPGSYLQTIQL
jgi:hypothetical protein